MKLQNVGIQDDDFDVFISLVDSFQPWIADESLLKIRQEDVSDWSVGEHIDHVLTADLLNLKAVLLLKLGRGQDILKGLNRAGQAVLATGEIPLGKSKAPDYVIPQPDRSGPEIEQLRIKVLDGWQGVASHLEEIDGKGQGLPHFAVGELGARQWLRFARIHTQHHLNIVKRVLGDWVV
ncbi:MAG: DUF1569 domain-containing protein [Planctomycetota bacterium]